MATLNWIGRQAVVNLHRAVPYRLLQGDPKLSVGENGGVGSGNLLVQGDNLEALKSQIRRGGALLPYYGGKVKCIYISQIRRGGDPPPTPATKAGSTTTTSTQPQFKEWIGQTVGKEGEDACRHDKWCCMMYPRSRFGRHTALD